MEEERDLYTENNKTLPKEMKETPINEDIRVRGLEDLIFLRCPYCPKGCKDSVQALSKSQ